jgi:hypothetical protein
MRSYMNHAVLALAALTVSPALPAPIQYKYGNLPVEFNGRAVLISGIPLGTLGTILITLLTSFVASNSLILPLTVPVTPVPTFSNLVSMVPTLLTLLTLLPNPVLIHCLTLNPNPPQLQSHLLQPQLHLLQPHLHLLQSWSHLLQPQSNFLQP